MAVENPIRLLIADGRTAVREGMARLLAAGDAMSVSATACSAEGVAEALRRTQVDVALIADDLPGGVTAAVRALRAACPTARLIGYGVGAAGTDLLRLGAVGIADPATGSESLIALIRRAARAEDGSSAPRPRGQRGATSLLTARERELLLMIAAGSSNASIAARTGLSPHTVRAHLRSIARKLGVRNRAHAVSAAVQSGQIALDRAS